MTERARELPDTDWHVIRLYEFAKDLGASVIAANMSRYVVDLNRSPADEALYDSRFVTGLCPEQSFDGEDIYLPGHTVGGDEKEDRIVKCWSRLSKSLKPACQLVSSPASANCRTEICPEQENHDDDHNGPDILACFRGKNLLRDVLHLGFLLFVEIGGVCHGFPLEMRLTV